ncbi:hypothetical protein IWX64_003201 [Arthrobacter sp. CAN_A212]|uniref:TRAFs-binding domain-containing protein n=1 Tax=Arthrobacter sp. CAN_A212 TaxID=2787719 RepID=UPI0018CA19F7
MNDALKPMAFIAMPYGKKRESATGLVIDFDDIWDTVFRPAAEEAGLDPVRADGERLGGFVHLAMFERLVLSEIVLADLTLASPNVMYELGIRHATRPRATISTYATVSPLPFDVSPIRAIPYKLDGGGRLRKKSRNSLFEILVQRFQDCREDTASDSPLFQLIRDYPGVTLSHEATESFKYRTKPLISLSNEIRAISSVGSTDGGSRNKALQKLAGIRVQIATLGNETPTDLLVDLFLAYRDLEAFDEMVTMEAELPGAVRQHSTIRQQLAFALNRRREPGDVQQAISIVETIVKNEGPKPETMGIFGRIHKDEYIRLRKDDPRAAHAALITAIETYEQGFRTDSRDYYPGVNAVTLMIVEGSKKYIRRARDLSPIVAFAAAGRQEIGSGDHWGVATRLELAVGRANEKDAQKALETLLYLDPPQWAFKSLTENLILLQEALERDHPIPWLGDIVDRLCTSASGR